MEILKNLQQYLPVIIPIVILEAGLFVAALIHLLRHRSVKRGSFTMWLILLFVGIIGPVLYFLIGREDS